MSFALFNSGAAQAYANSFNTWQANGGFDKVKSNVATDILTKVPFLNFQAEVEMAKAGLAGYTGATKQRMVTDSNEKMLEMRLDFAEKDREDKQKFSRKTSMAQSLMGGGGAARALAAGGGGGSGENMASYFMGGDPGAHAVKMVGHERALQGDIHQRLAPTKAVVQSSLVSNTSTVKPSSAQIQAPTVQTPKLEVGGAPSSAAKSDQPAFTEEQFNEFIKSYGGNSQ